MTSSTNSAATIDDFLAIPEAERFHELVDGEIVRRGEAIAEHGMAQSAVIGWLRCSFHRPAAPDAVGGWWLGSSIEVLLARGDIVCPDVVGWRRERVPAQPHGLPVRHRPDWICEVLSPSSASLSRTVNLSVYHRAEIPHYWVVDPREESLFVMRWCTDGYATVQAARAGDRTRPEPFDAIEIDVGTLFGDDPAG